MRNSSLSPYPDMSAKGIDALFHTWDFPVDVVCFSPDPAANSGSRKIRATSRPVLLLAPAWPKQLWYRSVVELSVAQAVHLPFKRFPLLQGNFIHPSSKMFKLHTWTLLGTGQGFSARAASFFAQSVRPSTSLVYDRKWDIFCTWCAERQIDPVSIPIEDIGDFLLFLFEELEADFYPGTVGDT